MNPPTYYTTMLSPIDDLLLVSDGDALVGLYMDTPRTRPGTIIEPSWQCDPGPFRAVTDQLAAYFAGDLARFDLPIRLRGTDFQQVVWAALQALHPGERISYGELARRIGRPSASRAVGLANGRNPVSIIVPCHRVIGAAGTLTGYGGGLSRKRWLLDHEVRFLPRSSGTVTDQPLLFD